MTCPITFLLAHVVQQFGKGAFRYELAMIQDGDPVAERLRLVEVVRGENHGNTLLPEPFEHVENGVYDKRK